MASPELDNRAAVVLLCVVTRQMDSSPTPLPLAVQAATTPPLLCEVAAERSMASRDVYGASGPRANRANGLYLNFSGCDAAALSERLARVQSYPIAQ